MFKVFGVRNHQTKFDRKGEIWGWAPHAINV